MKLSRHNLSALIALSLLTALAGCTSVSEGPANPPAPNQQQQIIGKEPEHAPIPQKDVPPGESPLTHKNPDERIDQPKG